MGVDGDVLAALWPACPTKEICVPDEGDPGSYVLELVLVRAGSCSDSGAKA